MIGSWAAGTSVTLRAVGARVFWAYPTIVVEDTPSLVALYIPAGAAGKNVETRPTAQDLMSPEEVKVVDCVWERTDVLMLIVPGEAFSIYVMWNAGTRDLNCWYINLQEPIRRTRIGFDTMDRILDVVVRPDMTEWYWKDEDEFDEAERVAFYSHEVACGIRADGERAIGLLTSERRNFYKAWESWCANPAWELPRLSPLWAEMDIGSYEA